MRLLRITAPLTTLALLALLTGACAFALPDRADPVATVSPANGPGLKRVWGPVDNPVNQGFSFLVLGTVIVRLAEDTGKAVFIDGTTGRIRARLTGLQTRMTPPPVYATTDARGRPLVAIDETINGAKRQNVYDTNGHLIWRAFTQNALYAGGYVEARRQSADTDRPVIRTMSGRVLAHLPVGHPGLGSPSSDAFQAVRPGLLAASGIGTGSSQAALIDVSRPNHARVSLLHPPAKPPRAGFLDPQTAAGAGHLYVSWSPPPHGTRTPIARYDGPGPEPVWHVRTPPATANDPELHPYPGPNGHDEAIGITNGPDSWLLNPDTGAQIHPPKGIRYAPPTAITRGQAYAQDLKAPHTDVINLHTGAVRTINVPVLGVTTNGYVLTSGHAINAYRWT